MGAVIMLGVIADRELQRRRMHKIMIESAAARATGKAAATAG